MSRMSSEFSLAERYLVAVNTVLARAPVWIAAVTLLAALQVTLIVLHQPWADELQALLIVTEVSSQSELLEWLRYEGHPPGWYWLLQAISAAVPFEWVLPCAALICASVVQGIILFTSPFSRAERLLIASSQYVLYEFLTISRGTSLGVALIFMALVLWRSRWLWVVMAALPLVDFLFGVISGVFLILKWRERDIWWPGVVIWLLGSAFAGWTVLPAPDMVSAFDAMGIQSGFGVANAWSWLLKIGSLPVPFQGGVAPQWNTPVVPVAQIAWIAFGWLCWRFTAGHRWHRLLIFGFFGFTFVFSLAVYPIGLRHMMLGCALLVGLVWLQRLPASGTCAPGAEARDPVWMGWLAVLAISGLATSAISTIRGFDSGDAVIAEIKKRGLSDKRWVGMPEWRVPAVSGRSDVAFSRLGADCNFRFVRWDHAYTAMESNKALRAALTQDIAQNGRGYLLSHIKFAGLDPDLIKPFAHIEAGYDGIDYYLYVIGRNTPERPASLPRCHSLAK